MTKGPKPRPVIDRFLTMVDKEGVNGCWLWTGARWANGYGVFNIRDRSGRRRTTGAHRFAYESMVGPIPDGLQIDHLCRIRNCVNPTHLEPVTHQENVRRARKLICKRGHTMADAYLENGGRKRRCRSCTILKEAGYRARRRASMFGNVSSPRSDEAAT